MALVKRGSRAAFVLGVTLGAVLTISATAAWSLLDWVDGIKIVDRFRVIERAYVQCGIGQTSNLFRQDPLLFGSTVWKGHVCGDGELLVVCKKWF
jgi:hypothetical protein